MLLVTRFWNKVNKDGPVHPVLGTNCWVWTGCLAKSIPGRRLLPYGKINVFGKCLCAHRVSYELNIGLIPRDSLVCHKCDNPSCVRPEHLFLGTQKDNVDDCVKKGRDRHPRGECHGRAKLTWEKVREIRSRHKRNDPINGGNALSREFSMDLKTILDIVNNKIWKE